MTQLNERLSLRREDVQHVAGKLRALFDGMKVY
jgi:hypothetical protein